MMRGVLVLLFVAAGCDGSADGGLAELGASSEGPDLQGAADMAVCVSRCSDDASQIVDCRGQVISQCGAGTQCAGSMCVSPCEMARQNKDSLGCDYWLVGPGEEGLVNGACLAVILANTSPVAAEIGLEFKGKNYPAINFARIPVGQGKNIQYQALPATGIPPGKVAVLFLAQGPQLGKAAIACPVPAAYTVADAGSEVTSIIDAFHVTTTVPVVAYDIYPYGGAASAASTATLLIPTSTWDVNYLAVDPWPQSANGGLAQPFIQVAAVVDGTVVTIRPTVDIVGGVNVAAGKAGQNVTYSLARGQVLQLKQNAELVGSSITSNFPVGVWGGASCLNIDTQDQFCDAAQQQLLPVKALGNEYVAARYKDRVVGKPESPPWRILGAVDGTQLTYDPSPPNGAPAILSRGQIVTFWTSEPFTVKSQDSDHPFYLSAHMTGCQYKGNGYQIGDPEFVNVTSPSQYLSTYDFFTDVTMGYTHLVLVRKLGDQGTFKDVTLDCLGVVKGWRPVGKSGQYETVGVDLVDRGLPVGSCNNGYHTARSDGAFGLTVWGWDTAVSYAYPAGARIAPINDITIQ